MPEATREAPDVGATAPSFELPGYHEAEVKTFTLESLLERGAVLLGTYPFNFTPVCTRMMCQLEDMDWYQYKNDLSVVAVSRDSPFAHERFAADQDISFPLLSDVDGQHLRSYGVLEREVDGIPNVPARSVLLIDSDRTIRYRWVADDVADEWENNPVEEAIEVLNTL